MESPAGVALQLCAHLGVLVDVVVVEGYVNDFSVGYVALGLVEESNELQMPVALHVAPDD